MPTWTKRVDINQYLDVDKPLTEAAELIEREMLNSGVQNLDPFGQLQDFLAELKEQAETGDPDYFDVPLGKIYDWCDFHRVWCGG